MFGEKSKRVRSHGHKAVSLVRTLQKRANLSTEDVVELCDLYTQRVLLLCRAAAAKQAATKRHFASEEEVSLFGFSFVDNFFEPNFLTLFFLLFSFVLLFQEDILLRLVMVFLQDDGTTVESMVSAIEARSEGVVRRVRGLQRLTLLVEDCGKGNNGQKGGGEKSSGSSEGIQLPDSTLEKAT